MRTLFPKLDWLILATSFLLLSLSLLVLFSTAVNESGTDWSFFVRQALYGLFGIVVFFLIAFSDYRILVRYSPFAFVFAILLLLVTYVFGEEVRGSIRWIDFGFVTLQASELAKPVFVLFLSFFVVRYPLIKVRHFVISLFILTVPLVLIFNQPDLGSSLVLGAIWLSIVFVAGAPLKYLAFCFLLPLVSFPLLWEKLKDYQRERLVSFLNPTADPLGSGYNLVQSIIAVGSGQFFGRGLGRGTQSHLDFLPEQKTDFIFATASEELGFLGVVLILGLFGFLLYRLFLILHETTDNEGAFIIIGTISLLLTQIFINVGMNLGILPITGITLPLVSFGGSSLLSIFILLGLCESVLLVARHKG